MRCGNSSRVLGVVLGLAPNKLRLTVTNIPADIIWVKAKTMGSTGPTGDPKYTYFCDSATASAP